jgi:hypothetical protein
LEKRGGIGSRATGADTGLEAADVVLERRDLAGAVLKAGELAFEFRRPGFGEAVDHPGAVPLGGDQPVPAQVGEVLGNRDLRELEDFLEMADAEGSAVEKVKETQPGLVAETAVDLDQLHIPP